MLEILSNMFCSEHFIRCFTWNFRKLEYVCLSNKIQFHKTHCVYSVRHIETIVTPSLKPRFIFTSWFILLNMATMHLKNCSHCNIFLIGRICEI